MEVVVLAVAILIAGAAVAYALATRPAPTATSTDPALLQALGDLRLQLQSLNSRSDAIERHGDALRGDLTKVQLALESTGTMTSGLRAAADAIRAELGKTALGVASLQEAGHARQQLEQSTADSIRRLEAVIAGTASKGAAGENLVELVFSRLPAEWQIRDFKVNNRSVEFALRLPNGRVLPIDAKWPATHLVEEFAAAETPEAAQRIRARIEAAVREKMREVQRYVDVDLTHGFGMAVVPDAVYDLCGEVRAEAFRLNVVLVAYSLFVPYLLLVYQTVLASSRDIDLERLARVLREAEQHLTAMSEELEGRLSRSITMLTNSRDDLRSRTATVAAGLGSIHVDALPQAGERPPD